MQEPEISQDEYDKYYDEKEKGLELVLGKMHNIVGHAIVPFAVGGSVDMYYFLNHIQGTGFATMELLGLDGTDQKPNRLGNYEFVAFTKHAYNENKESKNDFNVIERHICGILTAIGNYSFDAVLNPGDTCEIPVEGKQNLCIIFDNYKPDNKEFWVGDKKHHLLLCMEIFKNEMEFARKDGSEKLFKLLKEKDYYPYSDLDRNSVI